MNLHKVQEDIIITVFGLLRDSWKRYNGWKRLC